MPWLVKHLCSAVRYLLPCSSSSATCSRRRALLSSTMICSPALVRYLISTRPLLSSSVRLGLYRLCGDGLYFKLCPRIQLEVLSSTLLPGMYLPRPYVESLLASGTLDGSRGRVITFENTGRHVSNTLFADLVRDAWIGTRGVSSQEISGIVATALDAGRSLVLGRGRSVGVGGDLEATKAVLGL
jgi:hypothetical protein